MQSSSYRLASTWFTRCLGLALACALVACGGPPTPQPPPTASQTQPAPQNPRQPVQVLPSPALAQAQAEGVSIADVVEQALPAVVNVSSTRTRRMRHPFHWFFGPGGEGPSRREQGQGSGVIVSNDGVVLTNNHVVDKADEIMVTTSDGREFEAKVLGTDPQSDLAVLKLQNASGLSAVKFGDSAQLRLGDVVLAIGNPFGIGQTVTMGIVSAKGRADLGIVDYEDFIQTDAAINPGNSGGALINMRGELVGINTAILSRSGGYQGVGFAIPSNMAQPIMHSLQQTGRVVRGWLGVAIQQVDQELAKALKLSSADGVLISDVKPGGPADRAGIKRGDVVLRVAGKPVDTTGRLRNLVAQAGANARVQLDIVREGKSQEVSVTLGEMPTDPRMASAQQTGQVDRLDGLMLESLTPDNRKRFNLDPGVKRGVVVSEVEQGSPAARAGLRAGDVILEVNRSEVNSPAAFKNLYQQRAGIALLLVHRGDSTVYVVVRR